MGRLFSLALVAFGILSFFSSQILRTDTATTTTSSTLERLRDTSPAYVTPQKLVPLTQPKVSAPAMPWIQNNGQYDSGVAFKLTSPTGTSFITTSGTLRHVFTDPERGVTFGAEELFMADDRPLTPVGRSRNETLANFLLGEDTSLWRRNVPTWDTVSLGEVVTGISLEIGVKDKHAETFFTVAPKVEPSLIRVQLGGIQGISIDAARRLVVRVDNDHTFWFLPPTAHQMIGGRARPVQVSFLKKGSKSYGFTVGGYDRAFPLIIDPVVQLAVLEPFDEALFEPPESPTARKPTSINASVIRWNFTSDSGRPNAYAIVNVRDPSKTYVTTEPYAAPDITFLDEIGLTSPATQYCGRAAISINDKGRSRVTTSSTFPCAYTLPLQPKPLSVFFVARDRVVLSGIPADENPSDLLYGIREVASGRWVAPASLGFGLRAEAYGRTREAWGAFVNVMGLEAKTAYRFQAVSWTRDNTGYLPSPEETLVTTVVTPEDVAGIAPQAGEMAVSNRLVLLRTTPPVLSRSMEVTNRSDFADAEPQPIEESFFWDLCSTEGGATHPFVCHSGDRPVFVRFTREWGEVTDPISITFALTSFLEVPPPPPPPPPAKATSTPVKKPAPVVKVPKPTPTPPVVPVPVAPPAPIATVVTSTPATSTPVSTSTPEEPVIAEETPVLTLPPFTAGEPVTAEPPLPLTIVTFPAAGATLQTSRPIVSGTGTPGTSVTVLVDDAVVTRLVVGSDGVWNAPVPHVLADGAHTVRVDVAGVRGSSVAFRVAAAGSQVTSTAVLAFPRGTPAVLLASFLIAFIATIVFRHLIRR